MGCQTAHYKLGNGFAGCGRTPRQIKRLAQRISQVQRKWESDSFHFDLEFEHLALSSWLHVLKNALRKSKEDEGEKKKEWKKFLQARIRLWFGGPLLERFWRFGLTLGFVQPATAAFVISGHFRQLQAPATVPTSNAYVMLMTGQVNPRWTKLTALSLPLKIKQNKTTATTKQVLPQFSTF